MTSIYKMLVYFTSGSCILGCSKICRLKIIQTSRQGAIGYDQEKRPSLSHSVDEPPQIRFKPNNHHKLLSQTSTFGIAESNVSTDLHKCG